MPCRFSTFLACSFAFAKLVSQDNSYAVRKYEFQLGRASKNSTLDVALSPVSAMHDLACNF